MSKFSFFASGFCACTSMINFVESDLSSGIIFACLSIVNILVGVINK
jgi:hypothetical protein